MGKGEIARYEQSLLFPRCFHKIRTADMYKAGLVWERVNGYFESISLSLSLSLSLKQQNTFAPLQTKSKLCIISAIQKVQTEKFHITDKI